ncbi:MAG: hypothetical protein RLN75_06170, partial [Longimicrobiales bacterium]
MDVRPDRRPSPLREMVRFEVVHQLGRISTWVMFGLFLFPLVGVTLDDLADAQRSEALYHSSLQVAQHGAVMGIVALLILASVAGDAATRDIRTGLEPLVLATPVDRLSYLGGRFLGAFAIAVLLGAAIPLAHLLVPLTQPEAGPDVLGAAHPGAYALTLVLLVLPNAFIGTAILFTLATRLRHGLGSWLGVAVIFFVAQFTQSWFGDVLGRWDLARALDPTGVNA